MRSKIRPIRSIITSFVIVAVAMYLLYSFLPLYEDVSIQISLQFEGIEEGKNPDNTRFDYNMLVSDDILKTLFETAGISYDPSYASQFQVSPLLPNNIVNTIKAKRIAGEDYTYFPNEFKISIHPSPSSGLDLGTTKLLAAAYPESFETYFKENYTFPFVNLEKLTDEIDFTKYDYPEYETLFENKYNIIGSYLDALKRDDPEFVSSEGYTFKDLSEALSLSEDLDIKRLTSLIDSYNLSKDSTLLRNKYEFMIRRYELDRTRVNTTYQINQALLNIVEDNKSTVLLPGVNGETVTYSQVNDTYDDIASKVTDSLVDASNYDEEIAHIQDKLTELDTPSYSAYAMNTAKNQAVELSNELKDKLNSWIMRVNDMAKEYFDHKYTNAVFMIGGIKVNKMFSFSDYLLLGLVLWLLISMVTIQRNYTKYNKYNKSKNIELN